MINKLKNKFKSKDNKRLLSNFISLSVLQGVNYILPLITLPYIVRVVGVENYGLLAFATATTAYFGILTGYGFNLTAPKEISINRGNKSKVTEIFSSVLILKFFLLVISFVLLVSIVLIFRKFRNNWLIYLLTFGNVFGQVLFPVWLFQGMERMKYITYINIVSRIIFTAAVFIFIHNESDFYFVPLLNSAGSIIAGIWALGIVKKSFGISFKWQRKKVLVYYLKDALHIFISNIAISLYTVSTTFILGLLTNNIIVGYFAAGNKIIQAFMRLLAPVSQSIYPYIARKAERSKEEGLLFIRKVMHYIGITTGVLSVSIFIFADFLVMILLGDQYQESVVVVRILAVMPLLVGLSNIFGVQTMVTFNHKKAFSRILVTASVLNLILSFILVPLYQYVGSALSTVIVESCVTLTMFIYLQKNGLKLIGENNNV